MLTRLNITDFAIIKDLAITLKPGLNILSGETGAGKSIIINAVNLILGGRASADLIRSGCGEARVEALFSFPDHRVLSEILAEYDLPFEGELLIKRTVSREGRNRISINGSMATLQMLSRLSSLLISISGQHEHQLLLKPENHLFLLDDSAALSDERRQLEELFASYQSLKNDIQGLEKRIREIAEKQELSRFQIQEIEAAHIQPEQDEALFEEKKRLQHAEDLLETVSEAYQMLYESSPSVVSFVAQCVKKMEKGAAFDARLKSIQDSLRDIEINLEDVSFSLRDFQKTVRIDPQRLEQVIERIELLNRLKRKYGATLTDVLRTRDSLAGMMEDIDEKKDRLEKMKETGQNLVSELLEKAARLSERRKKAARTLEEAVEQELKCLHMQDTRFQVKFEERATEDGIPEKDRLDGLRAEGFDRPEFLIAPNVGEALRPLSKIASGGELSRILLAVKTILARSGSVETVVFDEVDAGVSGATAEVVGEKVSSLARYHQILCITHLPQIACQGQNHFLVKKEVIQGRTQTVIAELDEEARVMEIARLLGGKRISRSALSHAREMLSLE